MKKLVILSALLFVFGICVSKANAAEDVIIGEYANDAGTLTVTKAKAGQNANYDVAIADKSGKCSIQIVAATNSVTAKANNGYVYNPKTIVTVQGESYNAAQWPVDQKIVLADDVLPFAKLDNACQAFKGNMEFKRVK